MRVDCFDRTLLKNSVKKGQRYEQLAAYFHEIRHKILGEQLAQRGLTWGTAPVSLTNIEPMPYPSVVRYAHQLFPDSVKNCYSQP